MHCRHNRGQVKEESNYWQIPGQWANELHIAVEVQGTISPTQMVVTLNVNACV